VRFPVARSRSPAARPPAGSRIDDIRDRPRGGFDVEPAGRNLAKVRLNAVISQDESVLLVLLLALYGRRGGAIARGTSGVTEATSPPPVWFGTAGSGRSGGLKVGISKVRP
jgi:hypothetical protein